jgi:hypothetical protein
MSYITNSVNGVTITNAPSGPGQVLSSTGLATAAWGHWSQRPETLAL